MLYLLFDYSQRLSIDRMKRNGNENKELMILVGMKKVNNTHHHMNGIFRKFQQFVETHFI